MFSERGVLLLARAVPAALAEVFISSLVLIASKPTRIRESKGLLCVTYVLQAETSDGWKRVPGSSAFRWSNIRFPEIEAGATLRSEPYGAEGDVEYADRPEA